MVVWVLVSVFLGFAVSGLGVGLDWWSVGLTSFGVRRVILAFWFWLWMCCCLGTCWLARGDLFVLVVFWRGVC